MVCLSNMRQLAIATTNYAESNKDQLPHYLQRESINCTRYWFGEENTTYPGPGVTERKLDLSGALLAPYLAGEMDERITCPDFPYGSGHYFPKFDREAASYGMNAYVTGAQYAPLSMPGVKPLPHYRLAWMPRPAATVLLADAVHMDGLGDRQFNDAIYLKIENQYGGFAHFRHAGAANITYLDGHAKAERFADVPRTYGDIAGSEVGNLTTGATGIGTPYGKID